MTPFLKAPVRQTGFSMIEVLVTLVILLIGLLGLAGLMIQGQRVEMESYQRVQALILMQDMVGRINANRTYSAVPNPANNNNAYGYILMPCYAFSSGGTPFLGTAATFTPACTSGTPEQNARAIQDMQDWNALLQGSAELAGGTTNAGAMIGARGCISFNAATSTYQISVAWQGNGPTAVPPASMPCATSNYGDEKQRRVVSVPLS